MSGATSRSKGIHAEVELQNWLREHGWPDARRYMAGDGRQPGDIDGPPGLCLEVKNAARIDLPGWLRQCESEAKAEQLPVVVIRPRGQTDPARWAAVSYLGLLLPHIT